MKQAIIDIGSHSVRMLYPLEGKMRRLTCITRLREGMQNSALSIRSIRRTAGAVARFVQLARQKGLSPIAFATSAMREATNAELLVAFCHKALDVCVDIVCGEREAELAFLGAAQAQAGIIGVLDIGGGSTEVTWGENGKILTSLSFSVGTVRMTDMDVSAEETAGRTGDVLHACPAPPKGTLWKGMGGTITSLAAMDQQLEPYDETKVNGYVLTQACVRQWMENLQAMTLAQRMKLPGLQRQRAHVILAGVGILLGAMGALGMDSITACTNDNLDGYAMELAMRE